jgi:hypothetical protein
MTDFVELMPPLAAIRVGADIQVVVHWHVNSDNERRTVVSAFDSDGNFLRQLGAFSDSASDLVAASLPAMVATAITSFPEAFDANWEQRLDEHLDEGIGGVPRDESVR